MYERYFQEVARHAAEVARAEGQSWQEIGAAVGISKQAAWERWRRPQEPVRARPPGLGDFPVSPPKDATDVFAPMVENFVDDLLPPGDPMRDDLLAAGRRALAEAIESHRSTPQKVPFTVYASWHLDRAVIEALLKLRERARRGSAEGRSSAEGPAPVPPQGPVPGRPEP